jgi:hypothetical protein
MIVKADKGGFAMIIKSPVTTNRSLIIIGKLYSKMNY